MGDALSGNGTNLIFPQRLIPTLLESRGEDWQRLVRETLDGCTAQANQTAFVLTIARLAGCSTCHADALRALRGCSQCARQSVNRYRGSDQELVGLYHQAHQDVLQFLASGN
jgi:hypothetical protein